MLAMALLLPGLLGGMGRVRYSTFSVYFRVPVRNLGQWVCEKSGFRTGGCVAGNMAGNNMAGNTGRY